MLNTILFDLDGTLAPFQQDEFVRVYFGLLVRRLVPMGYDGEKLVRALWKGVDAMIGNSGAVTNRQVFWECFTQEMGMQALAWRRSWTISTPRTSTGPAPASRTGRTGAG